MKPAVRVGALFNSWIGPVKKLLFCLPLLATLAACAPPAPEHSTSTSGVDSRADPAPVASSAELAKVAAAINAIVPDLKPDHIRATPMPGIYEIQLGMNFGYVTADGHYLISGDLTDLQTRREITEDSRRVARVALVEKMDKAGFIEFAPEKLPAKYTVTVFTDVDCGYCRMLHRQIKNYNDEGIAVRYMFFPRSGANTASFFKAEEVWCSADRKAALTQAKSGVDLHGDKSCPNPIAEHLQAAADLGLRGTPSIVLPDGELVPGYRPPADLLQILQKGDAGALPTG